MSDHSKIKLVCLPYAGAGASVYRPWQALAGSALEIVPVRLPGRERLIDTEPHRDVHLAADWLLADLAPVLTGRVALFGHSMGAVLAYELAHRLAGRDGVDVVRLFASGSPDPFNQRRHHATGLSDDEFLARVAEFAGYVDPLLDDPELREMVLPTLRADVEMHEKYRPATDEALPVPITVIRAEDDHLVTHDEAAAWAKVAGREFEHVEMPGGHMYLVDEAEALLRLVVETVV